MNVILKKRAKKVMKSLRYDVDVIERVREIQKMVKKHLAKKINGTVTQTDIIEACINFCYHGLDSKSFDLDDFVRTE